jgi:serine/threonine protein kinase
MRVANYEYFEKIGQGAFGEIYKGYNVRTGEKVVVKMEPLNNESKISALKHESSILNILYSKHCRNIPPTYWYGTVMSPNQHRVLVMPFYEESLEHVVIKSSKMASNIMRSAISILNHIHDKYVVHRDIKPANFMIHNNELVLIDFGLASFYVDSNEKHILPAVVKKQHIIGTPKYASWNVHCGEEYSRRDDLLSVVYIGLFLMYGAANLWADFSIQRAVNVANSNAFKIFDTSDSTFVTSHSLCLRNCPNAYDKSLLTSLHNQWFREKKELANIVSLLSPVDGQNGDSRWPELESFAKSVYGLSFQERPSYKNYIDLFAKTI